MRPETELLIVTVKSLLITTAAFTGEAKRKAVRDGVPPIELIDGEKLVDLLEEFHVGLKPAQTYAVEEAFFEKFRAYVRGKASPLQEDGSDS